MSANPPRLGERVGPGPNHLAPAPAPLKSGSAASTWAFADPRSNVSGGAALSNDSGVGPLRPHSLSARTPHTSAAGCAPHPRAAGGQSAALSAFPADTVSPPPSLPPARTPHPALRSQVRGFFSLVEQVRALSAVVRPSGN